VSHVLPLPPPRPPPTPVAPSAVEWSVAMRRCSGATLRGAEQNGAERSGTERSGERERCGWKGARLKRASGRERERAALAYAEPAPCAGEVPEPLWAKRNPRMGARAHRAKGHPKPREPTHSVLLLYKVATRTDCRILESPRGIAPPPPFSPLLL
jgi:hypothetical protein